MHKSWRGMAWYRIGQEVELELWLSIVKSDCVYTPDHDEIAEQLWAIREGLA